MAFDKFKINFKELSGKLMRRKSPSHQGPKSGRSYNLLELTFLNIGTSIGVGPYVLIGYYAQIMGPGMLIAYLTAGTIAFGSLACDAELASRASGRGGPYLCIYQHIGEFPAAVVGWLLILRSTFIFALNIRVTADIIDYYSNYAISQFITEKIFSLSSPWVSYYPSLLCIPLALVLFTLSAFFEKELTPVCNLLIGLNLFVIILVIVVGGAIVDWNLWSLPPKGPNDSGGFLPFGILAVFQNSDFVFFSYLGYDTAAQAGSECREPHRLIPISMLISHASVTIFSILLAAIFSLTHPYNQDISILPIVQLFQEAGIDLMTWVTRICIPLALVSCILANMFPLSRILYATAEDGLMFSFLTDIHLRNRSPLMALLFVGLFIGLIATFFNMQNLVELLTLTGASSFHVLALCVMYLRYSERQMDNPRIKNLFKILFNMKPRATTPNKATSRVVGVVCLIIAITSPPVIIALSALFDEGDNNVNSLNKKPVRETSLDLASGTDEEDGNIVEGGENYMVGEDNKEGENAGVKGKINWTAVTSIGVTYLAILILLYSVVSCQPKSEETFFYTVKPMPLIPFIAVFSHCFICSTLALYAYWRFLIAMGLGIIIYLLYGIRKSKARLTGEPTHR